jgi:hypothetical protein
MKRVMIADTCSIEKYPPSPVTGNVPLFYAIAGKDHGAKRKNGRKMMLFRWFPPYHAQ